MSKNEWKKWVSVVGRMLLAYALVFAQAAWATQNQATKDNSGSPQQAAAQQASEKQSSVATTRMAQNNQAQGEESESLAEEKPSRDGSQEGIKVHGHWTIEVRNHDGTLATHREFENSLAGVSASTFLANILSRTYGVGAYEIQLNGVTQAAIFFEEPGSVPPICATPPSGVSCSTNLTVTAANGTMTLAGSAVVAPSGAANFNQVGTFNAACNPTITPKACPAGPAAIGYPFTGRSLDSQNGNPSPVSLSPGQTVAVTVVISFS